MRDYDCARELASVGKDDLLTLSRVFQTLVDRIRNVSGSRILALLNVLAGRLLVRPDNWLRSGLRGVRDGVDAVAMDRYDDKVMLAFRSFGNGQAEHLVFVGQARFLADKADLPTSFHCIPNSTAFPAPTARNPAPPAKSSSDSFFLCGIEKLKFG